MPLTPEDVQNKEFTTVRLREGYDMQEVDEFLDEVEAELSRMQRENEELRDKLAAVTRGGGIAASAEPVQAQRQPEAPAGPAAPPSASAAPAAVPPGLQPSDAAAKVLALAQKTADELVSDSRAEADRLMADAKSRADKLDAETKAKAAKIEQDARQRAESMEQEIQKRRAQVFGKLESDRAELEQELEGLRAFEREYRSRLKAYLERELRKLEAGGVDDSEGPALDSGNDVRAGGPAQPAGVNSQGVPAAAGAQTTGGSLRSVASLLDDEQR